MAATVIQTTSQFICKSLANNLDLLHLKLVAILEMINSMSLVNDTAGPSIVLFFPNYLFRNDTLAPEFSYKVNGLMGY